MTYTARAGQNSPALRHFVGPDIELRFQDGPVSEFGVNGTTNEEVIELLVERIRSLNSIFDGKYACRENSLAITHLEEALHWLESRTKARMSRGVAGTATP